MQVGGRIWDIDFIPESILSNVGDKAWMSAAMAVGTGDYMVTLYDRIVFQATLQVMRMWTVRCIK